MYVCVSCMSAVHKTTLHQCVSRTDTLATQIYRAEGLISEDRSNKATLLLTIPRSLFKSSAKDSSLEILEFVSLSTSAVLLHLGALGRRGTGPETDNLFVLA